MPICGVPRDNNQPCQKPAGKCPVHRSPGETAPNATAPLQLAGPRTASTPPPRRGLPDSYAARDPRMFAWWAIGAVLESRLDSKDGAVVANLLRIIQALGPEPQSQAERLQEAQLRGRIMHGLPPQSPEEWEFAATLYNDEALAEFRRWEELLERDAGDVDEPHRFVYGVAHEREMPGVVEREDGP
jgi:hypothetical protein